MAIEWFNRELLDLFGPILPGRVYSFLASSGAGKTLFALNLLDHLLTYQDLRIVLVPTEEGVRYFNLLGCRAAGVSYRDFAYGWIEDAEGEAVERQAATYAVHPRLSVLPIESPTLEDVVVFVDAVAPDVLILDHFHELRPGRQSPKGQTDFWDHAMCVLAERAHASGLTWFNFVQVSRPKGRDYLHAYRLPTLESGKGSARIEQKSDVVGALSRKLKDNVDPKTLAMLGRGLVDVKPHAAANIMRVGAPKHRIDDEARDRSVLLHVECGKIRGLALARTGTDNGPPF